jgi:hypothetical protein
VCVCVVADCGRDGVRVCVRLCGWRRASVYAYASCACVPRPSAGLFDASHGPPATGVRTKGDWSRASRVMRCYTFDESLNGVLTAPSVLRAVGWAWVADEVSAFSGARKVRGSMT